MMEMYRLIILMVSLAMPLVILMQKKWAVAYRNYKERSKVCEDKTYFGNESYDRVTASHIVEEEVMVQDAETGLTYDDYDIEQL